MYAVIDLGGTNTSIVTFASLAVPQYTLVAQFPTDQDYARQLERILAALDGSGHQLEGVGMAIGAQLTPDGLAIEESWTMQAYVGHSIVSDVASATGVAVRAANDNVCGVLAETTLGVLQPWQRSAYLTVSTGTGAGIRLGKGNGSIAWLAQSAIMLSTWMANHASVGSAAACRPSPAASSFYAATASPPLKSTTRPSGKK